MDLTPFYFLFEEFPDAREIGKGGQKIVYEITHSVFGSCVLKVGQMPNPNSMVRIRREVETLRGIQSDRFPMLFEFKELGAGYFYIIEEYKKGRTLEKTFSEYNSVFSASHTILEIIEGVNILWEKKIVHRDVKPNNIIFGDDGKIYILDLGIARLVNETSVTQTLAIHGPCTPIYASPEQMTNRKMEIGHRSDQFSIGIIYAQLLMGGTHPFDPRWVGDGEDIVSNIMDSRFKLDSDILSSAGDPVVNCLTRLLSAQPYQRFRKPILLINCIKGILENG